MPPDLDAPEPPQDAGSSQRSGALLLGLLGLALLLPFFADLEANRRFAHAPVLEARVTGVRPPRQVEVELEEPPEAEQETRWPLRWPDGYSLPHSGERLEVVAALDRDGHTRLLLRDQRAQLGPKMWLLALGATPLGGALLLLLRARRSGYHAAPPAGGPEQQA